MTPEQVKRAIDHFVWLKCGYSPHIQKPRYQGRDYKARADNWILKKG